MRSTDKPSAKERAKHIEEMAGKTCDHIINYSSKPCEICVEAEILEAESAARAEGRREGMEAACREMCPRCVAGGRTELSMDTWHHAFFDRYGDVLGWEPCRASAIRALIEKEADS